MLRDLTTILLLATICLVSGCSGSATRLPSSQECPNRAWRVEVLHPDSMREVNKCELIESSVRAIGQASPRSGIMPSDSGLVAGVLIAPMSEEDANGSLVRSYWSLEFTLTNRNHNAVVEIDRRSGATEVYRTHASSF